MKAIVALCLIGAFCGGEELAVAAPSSTDVRTISNFNAAWRFHSGDLENGQAPPLSDAGWRILDLPHDWSIEGSFGPDNPATIGGGALPGGIGWYRKKFTLPASAKDKLVFIEFDGVYRNSEVWLNGHSLGTRPYGYSSFRYELTPFLRPGNGENVIAVRVDNSRQPNSRWYSGSGIYRNVRLVITGNVCVDHWGTYITTPDIRKDSALVEIETTLRSALMNDRTITLRTTIVDAAGVNVASVSSPLALLHQSTAGIRQRTAVPRPMLWSPSHPTLYRAVTTIEDDGRTQDTYETTFGIRSYAFDTTKGFLLNGTPLKIRGLCNHHDLGCLGSAINRRALERQLEILRAMGANAIRTSHNPPAPELLDLCDAMGFLVMDEAFDMWKLQKTEFDYALDWDAWHTRDLRDMILRDRNHPSIIIWSIGNEVMEQWQKEDPNSLAITRELAATVRSLDATRPITAACNDQDSLNPLIRARVLDLIGYNYAHPAFPDFPKVYPGKLFIATETTSALATRGHYDMPSDSIRRWPQRWDLPLVGANPDNTCSSYDNCSTPWGSTHEETWRIVRKYDFLSGMFVWTGFDYLGEPTPYQWPSRSSYFGIVDLAGFPKDAYYMYQSEWTGTPVLHLFPHWNWHEGDTIDMWTYTNCDEVELFLNGTSLGTKSRGPDDLHLAWRLHYTPGAVKAIGRTHNATTGGTDTLISEVRTAGAPAAILLAPDRQVIAADGADLSFITVRVVDARGTVVPDADNLVTFDVNGHGRIEGVDNGLQTSLDPFKASQRKAFNGLCLAVVRSTGTPGQTKVTAHAAGLKDGIVVLTMK